MQKASPEYKKQQEATDCKTKAEVETYKKNLKQQLAEVLASQMLAKAFKASPINIKMSEQDQLDVLNKELEGYAADIMNREDFNHMMDSAELSPLALDQLREKGASGKQLIDELTRHSKLVQLKETKAQREAAAKQAEAGMGKH